MTDVTLPGMSPGARMLGIGAYRPARVVTNEEVAGPIQSSDEWIQQRSGIVSRHFAGADETVLTMGVEAARKAVADSGLSPEQIDTVLLASVSQLQQCPATAPQLAHLIGAHNAAALDVNAACAGFSYALAMADSLVRAGTSRYVLVVASEKMTDIIDHTDRTTAFLFADGAGAAVVGPAPTPGIGPVVWGSDGARWDLIAHDDSWLAARQPDCWPVLRMAGQAVYRWALQDIAPIARQAMAAAGVDVDDLAAFVPHQANLRIVEAVAKQLKLPSRVVVANQVATDGNTSGASIPLAMEELLATGRVEPGGRALLIGFGAGLAHAAQVVTLP